MKVILVVDSNQGPKQKSSWDPLTFNNVLRDHAL